jgi:hypothetical protein
MAGDWRRRKIYLQCNGFCRKVVGAIPDNLIFQQLAPNKWKRSMKGHRTNFVAAKALRD